MRVLFTGLIALELGAQRFGMVLVCVCVMLAPIYLGLDSLLTMNVFESLFWMGAALIALKSFNGASPKLWLLFRRGVWRWPAEQALDDVFRPGIVSGLAADEPEEAVAGALAVSGCADCSSHFPAEPLVAGAPRLSHDSTVAQRSAQRPEHRTGAGDVRGLRSTPARRADEGSSPARPRWNCCATAKARGGASWALRGSSS